MISVSAHRLDFGDLDLANQDGGYDSYRFELLGGQLSWGSAAAVRSAPISGTGDGSYSTIDRHDNRVVEFDVQITATDHAAMADAERALALEVNRANRQWNSLVWYPADGTEIGARYEVVTAIMDPIAPFDDLDEMRIRHTWRVSLECRPWRYSTTEVEFTLGTGITTVDATTSMAAWTVDSGSASVVSGHVTTGSGVATTLSITSPVDLDDYLYLDVSSLAATPLTGVTVGGTSIPLGRIKLASGSNRIYTIPTEDWRGTRPRITLSFNNLGSGHALMAFDTQSYADRGGMVVQDVYGSARSELSLSLYRSAGALGDVFILTTPDPNEAVHRGVPTILYGPVTVVEGSSFVGEGGVVTVDGIPKTFRAGTQRAQIGRTKPQPTFDGRQLWVPTPTISTTASSGGSVTVGTYWQYPSDRRLGIVALTNITKKGLWLTPPSPDLPTGGIFVGDQADGSDAASFVPAVNDLWEMLYVHPERSGIMVKTSNSGVVTTGSYFPAYHGHPDR